MSGDNIVIVILCVVAIPVGLYLGFGLTDLISTPARIDDDRQNWNTVTALDMPISVTRIITADTTSFTYAPTGDEAFLFFSLDGESLGTFEAPAEAVRVSAPVSARAYREWPAVELKIVRQNGTEERYDLPTRGGATRWAFD